MHVLYALVCSVNINMAQCLKFQGLITSKLRQCLRITSLSRSFSRSSVYKCSIRIGCASGFWGDTAVSTPQLIHKGNTDVIVFDYLSEITMSLLTAVKQKMPEMGYAPDFVQAAMAPNIKAIKDKGIKVISNAGGVNPTACAAALQEVASKAGVTLNIAVVTGDDLMSVKSSLLEMGIKEMYSGISLPKTVTSMTAYLGAGPISKALGMGADVVITGRCTDSALVLAPLISKFKWSLEDYNLMACGSLAGHLIECGAQVTGGVFTDWHKVPDWYNIGFPIVECHSDGKFTVTKPPGTGGLISPATCAEQLLYEIGDPQNYTLPDVNCDLSTVSFTQKSENEVDAVGAIGKISTPDYKVCATYADGYRLTLMFPIGGPRAAEKGRRTAEEVIKRARVIFKMLKMEDFSQVNIQVLGAEDTYGENANVGQGVREAAVWMAATHSNKNALNILAREIAPAGTGMAPGLMGIAGGRPKVSPVMKLFSFLHPKEKFEIKIHMNGDTEIYTPPIPATSQSGIQENIVVECNQDVKTGNNTYRLEELAYTRSGDKGNHSNIGVIAREAKFLPYLHKYVTAEAVSKYMSHVFEEDTGNVQDRVIRYEVPGIHGFNFLLKNSLGGGGVSSLRVDPQGKAYGQMLLDFELINMPSINEI